MRFALLSVALFLVAGCAAPPEAEPEADHSDAGTSPDADGQVTRSGHRMEGKAIDDYSALPLNGQAVDVGTYAGDVVLLTVWASWCSICKGDEPIWDELQVEYGGRGLQVLAISREDSQAAAQRYIDEHDFAYAAGWDDDVNGALGMRNYQPNHMLVDRDGIIQSVFEGSLRSRPGGEAGLRADLETLLG